MPTPISARDLAAALLGCEPLDCKRYPDGSLVAISPTGQKFKFSPDQVAAVLPKPASKTTPKSVLTSRGSKERKG